MDPLLESVCEGPIRHSCGKEGDPLTVCKGSNTVNTGLYSLIAAFLISFL